MVSYKHWHCSHWNLNVESSQVTTLSASSFLNFGLIYWIPYEATPPGTPNSIFPNLNSLWLSQAAASSEVSLVPDDTSHLAYSCWLQPGCLKSNRKHQILLTLQSKSFLTPSLLFFSYHSHGMAATVSQLVSGSPQHGPLCSWKDCVIPARTCSHLQALHGFPLLMTSRSESINMINKDVEGLVSFVSLISSYILQSLTLSHTVLLVKRAMLLPTKEA